MPELRQGHAGSGWAHLIPFGIISVAFGLRWIDTSSLTRPVPWEQFAMKNAWLLLILLVMLGPLLDVSASY